MGKNGDVEFRINSPGDKFFYIKAIKDSSAPAEKTIIDACLAPKEGKLDYETQNIHQLSIVAKNTRPLVSSAAKAGIIPSDSINFTVKVLNVNEPPQFEEDLSIFEISENADPGSVFFANSHNNRVKGLVYVFEMTIKPAAKVFSKRLIQRAMLSSTKSTRKQSETTFHSTLTQLLDS